jgi:IS5 family transposase
MRRVLQGESVLACEKLVSLFEPHTAMIRKGKVVEFGRVLWLGEVEGGIITRTTILNGNPNNAAQVLPSLETHIQQFGRPRTCWWATANWRPRRTKLRRSSVA